VVARHVLFVVVALVGEWCVSVWVTVIGLMSPICCEEEGTARICARIHRGYMRTDVAGLCLRLRGLHHCAREPPSLVYLHIFFIATSSCFVFPCSPWTAWTGRPDQMGMPANSLGAASWAAVAGRVPIATSFAGKGVAQRAVRGRYVRINGSGGPGKALNQPQLQSSFPS